jgi:WD40 repeat protein
LASGQAAEMERLVRIFDTETLQGRQSFSVHDRPIASLAWHPSRHILATAPAGLTTKLWNPDTGRRLDTFRGPTVAPRVLNFSPSGQRLACAGLDRATRVWEPLSLQQTEGSK